MRREQVLKICLNHYISPDLELTRKDEKTWMWHAQDFSEGVLAPEQFACRFKTSEIAEEFAAAVEEAKVDLSCLFIKIIFFMCCLTYSFFFFLFHFRN